MNWIKETKLTERFRGFLANKKNFTKNEIQTLSIESKNILNGFSNPKKNNLDKTGLVIGYVQSGKTTSYEYLISLAGDNGYRLVIVLPGTNKILLNQTFLRLNKEMGVGDGNFDLAILNNPGVGDEDNLIGYLNDPHKLVVIVAMKHYGRIQNVVDLLNRPKSLSSVPDSENPYLHDEFYGYNTADDVSTLV